MSFRRRFPIVVAAALVAGLALSPGARGASGQPGAATETNLRGGPSSFNGTTASTVVRVTQFGSGSGLDVSARDGNGINGYSYNSAAVYGYGYHGNGVRGYSYYGDGSRGQSAYGYGVRGDGYNYGVYGRGQNGVLGHGTATWGGVFTGGTGGIYAKGSSFAGYFSGDTMATGAKSALVPIGKDRAAAVYAMESPEVWFEDFGSAQLIGGVAHVRLDPKFSMTVNPRPASMS